MEGSVAGPTTMVSRASSDREKDIRERRDQPQWLAGPHGKGVDKKEK